MLISFIIFEHPPPRLLSRRPMWSIRSNLTSVNTVTQWRQDWSSASVVNDTIVTDPTIRQPGFDLPRHTWSLLNRFRTGQDPCRANLHIWGLAQSPSCDCGQRQTANHIVDTCPLTKFEGGLCHGVSLGRFWKYNNFHLRVSLWILLRPPVARYGEAAIVWPRATCL